MTPSERPEENPCVHSDPEIDPTLDETGRWADDGGNNCG